MKERNNESESGRESDRKKDEICERECNYSLYSNKSHLSIFIFICDLFANSNYFHIIKNSFYNFYYSTGFNKQFQFIFKERTFSHLFNHFVEKSFNGFFPW